jgi:hypothetical protein
LEQQEEFASAARDARQYETAILDAADATCS